MKDTTELQYLDGVPYVVWVGDGKNIPVRPLDLYDVEDRRVYNRLKMEASHEHA